MKPLIAVLATFLAMEVLIPVIEQIMRSRATADWQNRFGEHNVPHALVFDHAELFRQDQVAARNMKFTVRDPAGKPVDLVGSPFRIHGAPDVSASMPPTLGEHTAQVLEQVLGLNAAQIGELRQKKIV